MNPEFPTRNFWLSPESYGDMQEIIMRAGYGNSDAAAVEIASRFGLKLHTNYNLIVMFPGGRTYNKPVLETEGIHAQAL